MITGFVMFTAVVFAEVVVFFTGALVGFGAVELAGLVLFTAGLVAGLVVLATGALVGFSSVVLAGFVALIGRAASGSDGLLLVFLEVATIGNYHLKPPVLNLS